jgi:hypothetical protein
MKKLARVTTTLMLAAAVLAGCGGDDKDSNDAKAGDPATTQSESTQSESTLSESTQSDSIEDTDWGESATGPEITGDGYTYRVPQGWGDVTKAARKLQSFVDSAASEKAATDGFADNINVGYQSTSATLDELEESLPTQLGALVKDLETLPRVTIDGVEALHHRGPAVSGGTKYFLDQFAALQDDRIAIITFSFSRDLPADEREALVSSMMASWKWS